MSNCYSNAQDVKSVSLGLHVKGTIITIRSSMCVYSKKEKTYFEEKNKKNKKFDVGSHEIGYV